MLKVKEMFQTMQGEGSRTGMPAVFLRFSGCNLWAGTASTRDQGRGACAQWCDTDFHGGEKMTAAQALDRALGLLRGWASPAIVISGGEPMLQLGRPQGLELLRQLRECNIFLALETNGTLEDPKVQELIDHITVSPKALRGKPGLEHIKLRRGHDLKVVAEQWSLDDLAEMHRWRFENRFIQPLDDDKTKPHDQALAALNLAAGLGWRVSIQTHKLLQLP